MKQIPSIIVLLQAIVFGTCFFVFYNYFYIFSFFFILFFFGNYYYQRSFKSLLLIIIVVAFQYLWCNYLFVSFESDKKKIESYNCCTGTIVDKKQSQDNNFFMYSVKTYTVFNDKQDTKPQQCSKYISIKSKENYEIGDFCTFKYIHWFVHDDLEMNLKYYAKSIICYGVVKTIFYNKKYNWFKNIATSMSRWMYKKKIDIIEQSKKILDPKTNYFFSAIILGNVDYENGEYDTLCKQWGIMHYLARSGLHVTLIIQCIMILFTFLRISYYASLFLGCMFLGFFYCISFPSLPFQRACVMYILNYCGIVLKRNVSIVNIFALCTCLFLVYNPFFIVSLSFQLSFLITGLLLIIKK
jgi:predicted membrane metal-binding protein